MVMKKQRLAFALAVVMAATSTVTAFAVQDEAPTEPLTQAAVSSNEPVSESTITYRISDEMYQKGVRFYNTDAQERTDTVKAGEPFQVKSFTAMKYNGDKLGGVSWKTLTEVQGYKEKNGERTDITLVQNQAISTLDQNNIDKSLIYDIYFSQGTNLYFEASAGIFPGEDAEMTEITTVIPKRMSVRLQDGTILKNGGSFQMPVGGTIRFQMCTNNWDTDTYTDDGQGLAGTKVYTFTHVKGKDNTLRVDTNTFFMAYRFHFAKGDFNKQTGIDRVLSVPLESLSVNLPLGSTVTVNAYRNISTYLTAADVFIATGEDKTLSYTDFTWDF